MIRLALLLIFVSCSATTNKIVIAHRGASGYLPEHTLESTVLAHSWDVDYIEPDIVATKDQHLIILHDIHLDTTTDVRKQFPNRGRKDGRFYAIDFTLKEIKTLSVTERRSMGSPSAKYPLRFPVYRSSFKIPTLTEFIELIVGLNKTRHKNVGIYPEIKSPDFHRKNGVDITQITLRTLKKYNAGSAFPIYLQCFDSKELKRMKNKLRVKYPLIQLIADNSWKESNDDYDYLMSPAGLKEVSQYASGIGMWIPHIMGDKNIVKNAHALGLKVHAYTVRRDELPTGIKNHDHLLDELFTNFKVDGIFSDFADQAKLYLSN